MHFNDYMRQKLISHGTMILLGCGYFTHAAKLLLEAGEYNIAIAICSKARAKRIRTNKGLEEITCGEGTKAQDFFHAAGKLFHNIVLFRMLFSIQDKH